MNEPRTVESPEPFIIGFRFRIGQDVFIGGDIPGKVTSLSVRGSGLSHQQWKTYEVSYWDGRVRHSEWLPECEIAVKKS